MRPALLSALLLLALALPGRGARADDDVTETRPARRAARAEATHDDLEDEDEGDGEREGRRRRFDYSRFSDGPRRVPEPRGASQRRAEALGLGTTQTASRLFHAAPDPR